MSDGGDEAGWDTPQQVATLVDLLLAAPDASSSSSPASPRVTSGGGGGGGGTPSAAAGGGTPAAGGCATVAPSLLEDARLLRRFLRARRGDARAAAAMVRRHSEWRAAACGSWWPGANAPLALVRAQLATGKAFCHGVDRQGRPAAWVRVRLHEASAARADIERLTIFVIDEVAARCEALGKEQASVVIDFEGFGMANYDVEAASFLMKTLSDNFPERLARLLFVRESMLFNMAWKIISLFVDARTARKISFLGSDFRAALLAEFDDAQIPTWLGGSSAYVFDVAHVDAPGGPNPFVSVVGSGGGGSGGSGGDCGGAASLPTPPP